MASSQSFESHTRLSPLHHGFVLPILLLNLGWCTYELIQAPSLKTAIIAATSAALIGMSLAARVFALTLQDRVIRLEMRLRLRDALPADLQPRIPEFSVRQLIALRFASDAELPSLAAQVLRDNIQDKKTIKKMIQSWQADHQRV